MERSGTKAPGTRSETFLSEAEKRLAEQEPRPELARGLAKGRETFGAERKKAHDPQKLVECGDDGFDVLDQLMLGGRAGAKRDQEEDYFVVGFDLHWG